MKKTPMEYFRALSAIPHVSGNEAEIADFVECLAGEKGYQVYRDEMHNLIVVKPASPGYEKEDSVILQGHLDMVGEKKEDSEHEFTTDPIKLVYDGDILRGDGTTLGADDGVAIAYILAILDDDTLVHPRLECVLTAQEETGLKGAQALDKSILKGTRMINLDAGPEGVFLTTCAGGCRSVILREIQMEPVVGEVWSLDISGLKGGHSGSCLQCERANALVLIGIVTDILREEGARLIHVEGGDKDNVIPSSASCRFTYPGDPVSKLDKIYSDIKTTWQESDPSIQLKWRRSKAEKMLDKDSSNAAIDLLLLLPHGVMSNSTVFVGLPESSANLAIAKVGEEGIKINISLRSSAELRKNLLLRRIQCLALMHGARVEVTGGYPGWSYEANSPLRDTCVKVYHKIYGVSPSIEGVHAGLECGVFKEAIPDIDIVALGPLYKEMHTPNEWLDIPSFERTYNFLTTLLGQLYK